MICNAHKCHVCNDCDNHSGTTSEDCSKTANTINKVYSSLGIFNESSGDSSPSDSCYKMSVSGLGKFQPLDLNRGDRKSVV